MHTVILLLLVGVGAAQESVASPGLYPVESYPLEEASVRARCPVGFRRRFDYTQCSSYEECVADGKATKWEEKRCADGYGFNDSNGNCELDLKCSTVENKCSIAFFRLSCSELLVCSPNDGAYIKTTCDDGFRNDFHGGCIADARCKKYYYESDKCEDGKTKVTSNCRTYARCEGGEWKRHQCVVNGKWNEHCSECDPEYKPRECKEGDSKSTNHTEPFEGFGIDTTEIIDCLKYQRCDQGRWTVIKCHEGTGYNPSMKRCTPSRLHDAECNPPVAAPRCYDGARIAPPHSCSHFFQCDRGEWRQMACPIGTRFDAKHNRCMEGICKYKHPVDVPKEYKEEKKEEGKGNAEYRRGHHHSRRSDESFSDEEFEIAPADPRFFQQRPIEIPPQFPQQRVRLNGAAEPLAPLPRLPRPPQTYVPAHKPGYLGQPEPEPAVVNPGHRHHHHHHQRPYRPQQPTYPAPQPQPQPYPVAPAQPHPQYPVQPAQPVYQEGVQPPKLPGLICEGDFKVADAFDSAFYYDCVHGYLKRKACPHGSRFDPQRSQCLKEYTWKPDVICYDNQVMHTAYCGEYRICRNNEWLSGICPHDWPFINGQCDKRRTCKAIATPPPPPSSPACAPGSVRPDFHNPLGYLECNYYYKWEKRACQQGEVFDKRISRCVYTAPSPSYPAANPPSYPPQPSVCYEGELRKDGKHCTKYEICHQGQFEPRYCPYGSGFNGYHCEKGYRCPGDSGVEGTCQESAGLRGFLPDRTDCAFFYQCAQGRWIRMPCAPGTHYSPTLGVCDHIGNVPGCGWNGPRPSHY